MSESRVERLMRLAEEAAMSGEFDRCYHLMGIAQTALELRKQESEEIQQMWGADARGE